MLRAEFRVMGAISRAHAGKRTPILSTSFYTPQQQPISEIDMHQDCINLLTDMGWYLVAHEWLPVSTMERCGRGDMVFQRNCTYLVMEAKRRKNKKVHDQAHYYGCAWKLQHATSSDRVAYGIWTNKTQEILGVVPSKRCAADVCWPKFLHNNLDYY